MVSNLCNITSMFLIFDQYFYFMIVNDEDSILYKYIYKIEIYLGLF